MAHFPTCDFDGMSQVCHGCYSATVVDTVADNVTKNGGGHGRGHGCGHGRFSATVAIMIVITVPSITGTFVNKIKKRRKD